MRVGILATARAPTAEEWARSPFRLKLSELGWVEGRNLKIERRNAASASELPQAARALGVTVPQSVLLRADKVIQ